MTEFVQWWIDHWPLVVVGGPVLALYPIWAYEVQRAWLDWIDVRRMRKRKGGG